MESGSSHSIKVDSSQINLYDESSIPDNGDNIHIQRYCLSE